MIIGGSSILALLLTFTGIVSNFNEIYMKKFKTEQELIDWIYSMQLQNTNGRETYNEMFKLGIEACLTELRELKLFSIPAVIKSVCDDCTAYPFDERGKTPLCETCRGNHYQTVL